MRKNKRWRETPDNISAVSHKFPHEQLLTTVDHEVACQLVKRLDQFLAPLLIVLDAYLDKRLVGTLVDLVVSLVQLRHREAGMLLSELGAMLLTPQQAPAGSKRISRLLHTTKWRAIRMGLPPMKCVCLL
jgi:hypothetical protein